MKPPYTFKPRARKGYPKEHPLDPEVMRFINEVVYEDYRVTDTFESYILNEDGENPKLIAIHVWGADKVELVVVTEDDALEGDPPDKPRFRVSRTSFDVEIFKTFCENYLDAMEMRATKGVAQA